MDHTKPWLRYVEAKDLDDSTHKFAGLAVKNVGNDKLGDVNGFVFDAETGEPYYVVVDAKGWFKTRHFLVPIGHAQLDPARTALSVDLTQDQIHKFPGFDLKEFERWTHDDIEAFDKQTKSICCDTTFDHYNRPDWWDSSYYKPGREPAMPHDRSGR